MRLIGSRTLKTGLGAAIAMIIAKKLNLEYASAAGIITILSIQSTKRQSVKVAFNRIGACILALIISSIIFKVFGYHEIVFGMFLIIFIPLTVKFNMQEGIVVSSVLISHLLIEKSVGMFWIINELSLMFVGIGVAILLNLYIPNIENEIREDQVYIEEHMKRILLYMAEALRKNYVSINEKVLFNGLRMRLKSARSRAYKNLNNYFFWDASYYVEYVEMRIQQFQTIKRMREHFKRFFMTYDQTIMISNFTEQVARSIYEENTAEELLEDLELLREDFRKMPLPLTREEFENRAMLIQFLNDMEQFINIKIEFKQSLGK